MNFESLVGHINQVQDVLQASSSKSKSRHSKWSGGSLGLEGSGLEEVGECDYFSTNPSMMAVGPALLLKAPSL